MQILSLEKIMKSLLQSEKWISKFMSDNRDRRNIIYAGANSGILHAINLKTGKIRVSFHHFCRGILTNNH